MVREREGRRDRQKEEGRESEDNTILAGIVLTVAQLLKELQLVKLAMLLLLLLSQEWWEYEHVIANPVNQYILKNV